MARAKRLLTNTGWLFLGRVLMQGLGFALTVLLARSLDEASFGQYSLITTIVFVGNVATTFGMDTLLIRQVAAEPASLLPAAALRTQLVLSAGFILIIGGGAWVIMPQGDLIALYSLSLIPLAFMMVYGAILRAAERMGRYLMLTVSVVLFQVVGVAALLFYGVGLQAVIGWLLLSQVMGACVGGSLARLTLPRLRLFVPHDVPIRAMLRQSVGLVLLMVTSIMLQRFGIFALSLLGNAVEIGLFAAALRLTDIFRVVPYAVYGALFPSLSRTPGEKPPRWAGWSVVGGGAVASLVLLVGALPLIGLVYGEPYQQAAGALRILALLVPLSGMTGLLDLRLVTAKREYEAAAAAGAGLTVATVMMLVMYPAFGLLGVCWATVIGEGVRVCVLRSTL